jgi:hypothetical protein
VTTREALSEDKMLLQGFILESEKIRILKVRHWYPEGSRPSLVICVNRERFLLCYRTTI